MFIGAGTIVLIIVVVILVRLIIGPALVSDRSGSDTVRSREHRGHHSLGRETEARRYVGRVRSAYLGPLFNHGRDVKGNTGIEKYSGLRSCCGPSRLKGRASPWA